MRFAIVDRALDPAAVLAEVSSERHGANILFVGTVRDFNDGEPVAGIDYSAYTAMAERELADIVAEACERWAPADVVVEHRIGTLGLGEASVVIAVGHPHRAEA